MAGLHEIFESVTIVEILGFGCNYNVKAGVIHIPRGVNRNRTLEGCGRAKTVQITRETRHLGFVSLSELNGPMV
jgi:hypothetical protein